MNPWAIPPFIAMWLIGGMGLLVYRRNSASTANRAFAWLCLAEVVWLFGFSVMYASHDKATALRFARLGFCGVSFIPGTTLHFLLAFLRKSGRALRITLWASYLSGILGLALSATNLVYRGIWTGFWGFYPIAGPLYPIFPVTFLACFNLGVVLLFLALRDEPDQRRRQQIKYSLFACICATPGVVDYIVKYQIHIYPFAYICALAWIFWITYAIVKHQLMDIRVLMTRTGLLLLTYFIVLGGPFAMSWWGKAWLQHQLGEQWWVIPLGLSTMLASVGPFVYGYLRRQVEDRLRRELAKKEMEASTDALTGLLIRRAFLERARLTLALAGEHRKSCSVLMIDLDHFKETNDTHGHLVGDVVLQEVATRLGRTLRQEDLLGRFGGEEFVLLLPDADRAQAVAIAERLREQVAHGPVQTAGVTLPQTISVGVATYPVDGPALDALIAKADAALYAAKRAGRNRVEVAS